ncbi:MAG TPA: hypothetical protein VFG42_00060 [Baekduia sp.]|uniref:hypothetical protein n=1 Tax=Baekduia sp. TaxID=2600305 RepID=UPI002D76EE83|nr:hypothetical protein [Baekduia sp.]HET6505153.1 hypothetical protein [Baekduia sp.]
MSYTRFVAAAAATLAAAVTATAASAATTPFYAIDHQAIETPKGVQPWLPTYTPDGRAIVFQSQLDGTTWTVPARGGTATCVTCSFKDRPDIRGGFTYAFNDNKRLFVSHELGSTGGVDSGQDADAWILECAPSVRACKTHKYLPVDMSADKGSDFIVQRRTWHLAPDGVHLAWSEIRLDGTVMVVAKLKRAADRYVATDQRVVNPAGPTSPADTDPQAWENASQLYELKSFADNGRSILALAERGLNTDVLKIDLATGRTTRFTGNPDWDEDGAISPDGALDVLYSWRTRHRLDALGTIPQLRGFDAMGMAAAVAPYYVSTWTGFQCDLSPWLLPGGGDANGTLIGQPLNTYGNGLTPGNNLSGQQFWSPDSTSVLLQERTTTRPPKGVNEHVAQKGLTPQRVLVAHIRRPAAKARRAATTVVGAWAPAPTAYHGTTASNQTVVLPGRGGGTATLSYQGTLADGAWSTTYAGYSEDGRTFLDGSLGASRTSAGVWRIVGTVTVRGEHTGRLAADLTIGPADAATGLPTKAGGVTTTYDGRTAAPLPALAACPSRLPRRSPVAVTARRGGGGSVRVTVTATIAGERRPVAGATVRLRGRRATTGAAGTATLRGAARGGAAGTVTVDAGDTFRPGRARVRG